MNSCSTPMHVKTICLNVLKSGLAHLGTWPALIVMLLGLAAPALAQLDTGSIRGVVTDSTGTVEGAAITAHEGATGTTYSTISSATGYYVFPSVRPGTYEVTVSAAGFKNAVYSGVVVAVGSGTTQDITLVIGATDRKSVV